MSNTQIESEHGSKTMMDNVPIQKNSSTTSSGNLEKAIEVLGTIQEDAYQFNKPAVGGKMTIENKDGLLIIVASLPGHELGTMDTDSGIMITVDGIPVVEV